MSGDRERASGAVPAAGGGRTSRVRHRCARGEGVEPTAAGLSRDGPQQQLCQSRLGGNVGAKAVRRGIMSNLRYALFPALTGWVILVAVANFGAFFVHGGCRDAA